MNIYEKIQKVKYELSTRELKKSGENKFSGFKYYELGDFMPSVVELCDKYGLCTKIDFNDNEASLWIIDTSIDNAIKTNDGRIDFMAIKYSSPMRELELKGANAIQTLGGIQTYLRRYLYMNAFDIVEADMFDSAEFEKKKKAKKEKGDLDVLVEKSKSAFKNANDELKSEIAKTMKTLGYASFGDVSKKQNREDIISLAQILNIDIPTNLIKNNEGE